MSLPPSRPLVGISSCLIGLRTRHDGTDRRHAAATALADEVLWLPVCPEVEAGFGVPRAPIRLVRADGVVGLEVVQTGEDVGARMVSWTRSRLDALPLDRISGWVLKARSPSCAKDDAAVHDAAGNAAEVLPGRFAAALHDRCPDLPLASEVDLDDPGRRNAFLARVRARHAALAARAAATAPARGHDAAAAPAAPSSAGPEAGRGPRPRYDAYDAFAPAYARWWGAEAARTLADLDRFVLADLPAPARVLDLACGTGDLAAALAQRGYEVVGLDGSAAMLDLARRNAPDATFVLGDARAFDTERPFDLVVCTFDSLNHVMRAEELGEVFRAVFCALRPGGRFAFDLNLDAKYRFAWRGSFARLDDDLAAIVRTDVDLDARVATFDAACFARHGDAWRRDDVHLEQTWYEEGAVRDRLLAAGFEAIRMEPLGRDAGASAEVRRALFLGARPSGAR